ncbi:tumor necrosis factor alpha-induced protein 2 isoform X2 [Amia ocellicauda]
MGVSGTDSATGTTEQIELQTTEGSPGKGKGKGKRHKLKKLLPKRKNHKQSPVTPTPAPPATSLPTAPPPPVVVLSFEENLEQHWIAEAGQQLAELEERLFGQDDIRDARELQEQVDKLENDYEKLYLHIWLMVENSFSLSADEKEGLQSASLCILQEEERDQRWKVETQRVPPFWRPRKCRKHFSNLLWKKVERRMENIIDEGEADGLSTSVKRDICRMGRRLQRDLLSVVRSVKTCYPPEFDICNVYARLYHAAFSLRLQKIADFVLDDDDCCYLLCWVHNLYPNDILKHEELEADINTSPLTCLLPEQIINQLEDQYLSHKESRVKTWILTTLENEEEGWAKAALPVKNDGCYHSEIAIDVIQFIDGVGREVKAISDNMHRVLKERLMPELQNFLQSYKRFLEEVMKGKQENCTAVVKANLPSIKLLRDYVQGNSEFFQEETEKHCLSLITEMESCAYAYLAGLMHEDLKLQYRALVTQAWLKDSETMMVNLVQQINSHLMGYRDLQTPCLQELVRRLHVEVVTEYTKRLLRKRLKLKDEKQQKEAANQVCFDSVSLQRLFSDHGSEEHWLGNLLQRVAEVLRLQDPSSVQLEIATLVNDYPDLSERHVGHLLYLKPTLPSKAIKDIRRSVLEYGGSLGDGQGRPFFSKVTLKTF